MYLPPLLALGNHIHAENPERFLNFAIIAGARNSHSRLTSLRGSAFHAPCGHSAFAFPLWFYSEFCISSPLLVLEFRIPAKLYNEHCTLIAGTRNSHSLCASLMNSSFQAPCWHSKFALSLSFPNEFCISSSLLVLEFRIPAQVL